MSFADVEYELLTDIAITDTIPHGKEYKINYKFDSDYIFCDVFCDAKVVSIYYSTPVSSFTIPGSDIAYESFIIKTPSKEQVNYDPDGPVDYKLEISCKLDKAGLCGGTPVDTHKVNEMSDEFILNYDLSNTEKQYKKQYKNIADSLQINVEDLYNRGNELYDFYSNLAGNILIPSNIQKNINYLNEFSHNAFEDFEDSQNRYKVLDMYGAYSYLSKHINTNFNRFLSDIANTQERLMELQQRHDSIVQDLSNIQKRLSDVSEELQRAGFSLPYFDLIKTYEDLQYDLNNLKFSSYDSMEFDISKLNSDLDELLDKKTKEEERIINIFNNAYGVESNKINSKNKLSIKSTLTLTIQQFCYDFENVIPKKFRDYNDIEQAKVDAENERNRDRNKLLESIRNKSSELDKLIDNLKIIAKDKVFDESLTEGCNVNPILNQDFQASDLDSVFEECQQYQTQLTQSIEENKKITSRFLNFFKYIFIKKPTLNQTKIPELNTYMKPTNLEYIPKEFNEETINIIEEYCDFNPLSISLRSPKEVKDISFDPSNTVIEFANIQGDCEILDCYNNRDTFPILFVHGHMFTDSNNPMEDSVFTFDKMIGYLKTKSAKSYDAGIIVSKGDEFLNQGLKSNAGVALFRTTYYGFAYIDSYGRLQFQKSNYQSIQEYANKLKDIIDATLETTGRKKLKIVAHSMGGLVTREYLSVYGNSKVDTFIMIGTPNKGTVGSVRDFCSIFGANLECSQMAKDDDNEFLLNLEKNDKLPSRTYILSGTYENEETDGIVLRENTELSAIRRYNFQSDKTYVYTLINKLLSSGGDLVHNYLVNPYEMQDVSDKVYNLLELG